MFAFLSFGALPAIVKELNVVYTRMVVLCVIIC
jgi:hypothetical protein